MCKGMSGTSVSGLLMMIPGLLFVFGGVLVLLEPAVLAWFMGKSPPGPVFVAKHRGQ